MLCVETRTLNSSHRKSAISSWYRPGFSSRCSRSASSIGGVIDRRVPPPFAVAFIEWKWRRLDLIALTERLLQSVTVAI
jgi:hypothetical protein